MLISLIVAGAILVCAFQAVRAHKLLASALWLAGASAITALALYQMGAHEVAVIELSVGAGLVTVLFIFAINITGDEVLNTTPHLPRVLAGGLAIVAALLLGWMALPGLPVNLPAPTAESFRVTLWQNRELDVLLQVVLIYCGVLGLLGLVAENGGEETHS